MLQAFPTDLYTYIWSLYLLYTSNQCTLCMQVLITVYNRVVMCSTHGGCVRQLSVIVMTDLWLPQLLRRVIFTWWHSGDDYNICNDNRYDEAVSHHHGVSCNTDDNGVLDAHVTCYWWFLTELLTVISWCCGFSLGHQCCWFWVVSLTGSSTTQHLLYTSRIYGHWLVICMLCKNYIYSMFVSCIVCIYHWLYNYSYLPCLMFTAVWYQCRLCGICTWVSRAGTDCILWLTYGLTIIGKLSLK